MKTILTLLLFSAACLAQVHVPTLTVVRFGDLERKLATGQDRAAYLTDDFEQRLCAAPGTPVPRDEWLAAPAQKFSFHQEAVHDYGNVATYSALGSDGDTRFMVVDSWKKEGDSWKLAVRYLCPAAGEKPPAPLPKRY